MSRVYNFSAGPAVLPEEVLAQAGEELPEWHGSGMSVMEMSHRGKHFAAIAERAEADLRTLLDIPDAYHVLFMQGGASAQFALVPMNLAAPERKASYLNTGQWSAKAIKTAGAYCDVHVVADGKAGNYASVPPREQWDMADGSAYLHYTPNETIGGLEIHEPPDAFGAPLVADMSSTLLSRPIDVRRFGLIYAGAQKNIGPAGVTLVIVAPEVLPATPPRIAEVFDYAAVARAGSMLNTPPTYAWYVAGLVFQWLLRQGGLAAMGETNRRKAELLYQAIDGSDFYANPVDPQYRSWMNVPFTLVDPGLEGVFLAEAENVGLVELKGHRSVGGMRASIYNAMPVEGVETLISFMADFEQRHG